MVWPERDIVLGVPLTSTTEGEGMSDPWKKCSVCKNDIPHEGKYYVCSVSTCNRKRTGLVFCSVDCWDCHLPDARHRGDAGAIEEKAPSREQAAREHREDHLTPQNSREERAPRRTIAQQEVAPRASKEPLPTDILVVASKVKKYVRDRSGMNTSTSTMEALTRCVIALCEKGMENAAQAERTTVMDRDIPQLDP